MAQILFLGKRFYENDLPFCYLPLWILISTPLIPQMLCLTGIICTVRKKRNRTDLFMLCFLLGGISTVMLIRPVLYNGWRHFYFFYVPFFWFAAAGLNALINHHVKIIQMGAAAIVCLSAIRTVNRITTLHPYEYIFLNQLVQDRIGDFDRDYWRLSTTECMEWIAATERDVFSVGEINSSLDNTLIGLMPGLRNKIHIINYNALHRYPADYLIFNYSGQTGNETYFPLYEPVYSIERDGVKLGEVFKRIASLAPEVQYVSPAQEIADGDFETQWCSDQLQNSEDTLLIEFTQPVSLQGLSLLPGDNEQEYARSPEIYTSIDGDVWDKLPITVSGLFDLSFPTTEARFIRIRNAVPAEFHWSIREILFY